MVTGDSLSMVTEAASTVRPLFVTSTPESMKSYQLEILNRFFQKGHAGSFKIFGDQALHCEPLGTTDVIRQAILRRLESVPKFETGLVW